MRRSSRRLRTACCSRLYRSYSSWLCSRSSWLRSVCSSSRGAEPEHQPTRQAPYRSERTQSGHHAAPAQQEEGRGDTVRKKGRKEGKQPERGRTRKKQREKQTNRKEKKIFRREKDFMKTMRTRHHEAGLVKRSLRKPASKPENLSEQPVSHNQRYMTFRSYATPWWLIKLEAALVGGGL